MSLSSTMLDESKQGTPLVKDVASLYKDGRKVFIESYGCQMNFSDSNIVASILLNNGYTITPDIYQSDVILLNTCSIREKAEQTVRNRLNTFNGIKKKKQELIIGILGCMAERLKSKLLEEEKLVDIVVGPDAYRELPHLLQEVESGQRAVNVLLSREETYADISPVRLGSNGVTAFVSIMRGCDNMCSFCVVPFTRGRERSRSPESIISEVRELVHKGYKEVTLLGQNVDSYLWEDNIFTAKKAKEMQGTQKIITKQTPNYNSQSLNSREGRGHVNFAQLLEMVAQIDPDLRVRFSTSHPKDMTDEVLHVIAKYDNICKYIHLPVQSGNTRILELMNRGYTREWYMNRINAIREIIPECAISTDIITGFCTETEKEHQETISLMEWVKFEYAYTFNYSERPNTPAQRKYKDDVPDKIKTKRLTEVIDLQQKHSLERNREYIGKVYQVLIEGTSKRSEEHFFGRNTQNAVVIFPKGNNKIGDYVDILVADCTSATLLGKVLI